MFLQFYFPNFEPCSEEKLIFPQWPLHCLGCWRQNMVRWGLHYSMIQLFPHQYQHFQLFYQETLLEFTRIRQKTMKFSEFWLTNLFIQFRIMISVNCSPQERITKIRNANANWAGITYSITSHNWRLFDVLFRFALEFAYSLEKKLLQKWYISMVTLL